MTSTSHSAEAVRERVPPRVVPPDPKRRTPARVRLSRGAAPMNPELTKEMKIIQFPVNMDKFTGYFDKFLKINDEKNEEVMSDISISYDNRLKKKTNIFSNFIE